MALTKINKVIIGATTIGGAGGALAYGSYQLKKTVIKDKLGDILLGFENKYSEKWKARASLLKKANTGLSEKLQKINTEADADGSKIKKWCQENIDNKFISNTDQIFLEVQKYCTYNIKDKIENAIDIGTWNDSKHNKKLKDVPVNTKLSNVMKEIKSQIAGDRPTKVTALKEWCAAIYDKYFKGNEDQEFLDAKVYCSYKEGQ